VTITRDMASQKVEWFLAAKKAMRLHPDWDDEKVAEYCGIPKASLDETVAPARREINADGIDPVHP